MIDSLPEMSDPFAEQMKYISGGTFQMGSNENSYEKPIHSVTVSSFYISKYEVTQKQWQEVMGTNPSFFKDCDNCPVENVSWNDTQIFIKKLNAKTGKNYRLPTEAEWEYAAKGGENYKYAGSDSLENIAWYNINSYDLGEGHKNFGTNPVGQKLPNGYDLYDMSGNVSEWCSDLYSSEYYKNSPSNDPKGEKSNGDIIDNYHTVRGGSWYFFASFCRITNRGGYELDKRFKFIGFRLVL